MGCNGVAVNVAEKMAKKENTITIIDGQADNFLIIEENTWHTCNAERCRCSWWAVCGCGLLFFPPSFTFYFLLSDFLLLNFADFCNFHVFNF